MEDIYFSNELFTTDLNIYHCGIEACQPGHSFGPAVRDHYLIHYILDGKGFFQVNNQRYFLKKGQGFLIHPEIVTYYEADWNEPWHYAWVGFNGLKAENHLEVAGLSREEPILTNQSGSGIEKYLLAMVQTAKEHNKELHYEKTLYLQGLLYMFVSELIKNAVSYRGHPPNVDLQDVYIHQALDFIKMNYSRKINITMIAQNLGLNRSYLAVLFKKKLKISPQDYLIRFRVERACELLRNPILSIGDVARSVGYDDPLAFSKIFKKTKGRSPSEYRKNYV